MERRYSLDLLTLYAMSFNKLVRDKIPEIIAGENKVPEIRILGDDEYKAELLVKLREEVAEYANDDTVEELADILEVTYALARLHGVESSELEQLREEKLKTRGGFKERIYLIGEAGAA
jgi:predicted house-cleaning noncanonical NTP pyrophosphatase (MazG superfamily)